MAGKKKTLPPMRQKFVDVFNGNATESALLAGYSAKTAYSMGARLLKNVEVVSAIKERESKEIAPHIASRRDRQRFWTEVMNDTGQEMKSRLKASELLGKSEADFTEKIQATGDIRVETAPGIDLSTLAPEQLYDMTRLLYGGGRDHAEEGTTSATGD